MAIKSFDEFWPFYVGEHSLKTTRVFHFWGTNLVIASIIAGLVTRNPLWILAASVGGYGPAW
ncbi:MAG: DUF962 domain-containing protein, partial [Candidatus Sericytochromatia bacterium]|nr:DUF962 domain-containing protein [Candidatus Sericytochromatia bacterium]